MSRVPSLRILFAVLVPGFPCAWCTGADLSDAAQEIQAGARKGMEQLDIEPPTREEIENTSFVSSNTYHKLYRIKLANGTWSEWGDVLRNGLEHDPKTKDLKVHIDAELLKIRLDPSQGAKQVPTLIIGHHIAVQIEIFLGNIARDYRVKVELKDKVITISPKLEPDRR